MLVFLFFVGANSAFSGVNTSYVDMTSLEKQKMLSHQSSLIIDNEMLGSDGTAIVEETLKSSPLYALLLKLEVEVPDISRTVSYVMLLNEVHQANQTLTKLLFAIQKNNQLLAQSLIKEGNKDG